MPVTYTALNTLKINSRFQELVRFTPLLQLNPTDVQKCRAWTFLCYFRILRHVCAAKCENNTKKSKLWKWKKKMMGKEMWGRKGELLCSDISVKGEALLDFSGTGGKRLAAAFVDKWF